MMKRAFAAVLAACLTEAAVAQAVDTAPSARPDFVTTYLNQKTREFQLRDRGTNAVKLGGIVNSLLAMLQSKGLFQEAGVAGRTADEKAKVRQALLRTVAYQLASSNLTLEDLAKLQGAGLDPLSSGAAVLRGTPTLTDALVVAETALVAEVVSNDVAANPVARRIGFRTDRILKGGSPTGNFTLDVSLPDPLVMSSVGEKYVIFLSATQAKVRKASGLPLDDQNYAQPLSALKVDGNALVPTVSGQESLRSTVADLDRIVTNYGKAFGL